MGLLHLETSLSLHNDKLVSKWAIIARTDFDRMNDANEEKLTESFEFFKKFLGQKGPTFCLDFVIEYLTRKLANWKWQLN